MAARMAMMAMTTSNSIKVNAPSQFAEPKATFTARCCWQFFHTSNSIHRSTNTTRISLLIANFLPAGAGGTFTLALAT